jgi:glycosyltransferase involved in cell wall biosynthesis
MVIAEALARGLPVVSTPTGAVEELVNPVAGELVPADDPAALRDVLRRLIMDRPALERLKEGARASRADLRSWSAATDDFESALLQLLRSGDGAVRKSPSSLDSTGQNVS